MIQNETTFTLDPTAEKVGLAECELNEYGLTISTFIQEGAVSQPSDAAQIDETSPVLTSASSKDTTESADSPTASPRNNSKPGRRSTQVTSQSQQHRMPAGSDSRFSFGHSEIDENALALYKHFAESRIHELEKQMRVLQERNKVIEERGKKLAQELDIFRHRRLVYWSDRFRNKFDAWHLMHPGFEEAKDDTMLFQGDLKGFRLLPSLNLVRLSSLRYELNLGRPGLCAILLAPIIDLPSMVGEICVRITDSKQNVLREVSVPIARITEEEPCELKFPSLEEISLNRLYVHIFAQGVDVPVRIFELRRYPKFGFAKLQRKLFAGYRFQD